jgi:hypothetical protein
MEDPSWLLGARSGHVLAVNRMGITPIRVMPARLLLRVDER